MSTTENLQAEADLLGLRLEYNLTVAARFRCECAQYFLDRRDALVPAVLREAGRVNADPVDVFAGYARSVHARHLAGLSLDADV